MNHAGEVAPVGFPVEWVDELTAGPAHPPRQVAIVGSHSATRHLAPFDDPSWEIWLLNEAPMKTEIYPRWDALLQMHRPEVYASKTNWVNPGYWDWLQQDHGRPVWMIEADARVPNSRRYPIEGVLGMIPYHYLRSSPALALGLAIYLGYDRIRVYGCELSSGTEYAYQATNFAFWIGFAHGRGVNLELMCWQDEFNQPIYGYEGEAQIPKAFYAERYEENRAALMANEQALRKVKTAIEDGIQKHDYQKVLGLMSELRRGTLATGETAGATAEAEAYLKREDMISRQEFERRSAHAQGDGEGVREQMYHAGGKAEYVWNVWAQTGRIEAAGQLRQFLKELEGLAHETGRQLGQFRENVLYLTEYDKLATALGGARAVAQVVGG